MDEGQGRRARAGEFLPDKEEAERLIEREWERMSKRGETIRVGAAAEKAHRRWIMRYGADFLGALRRGGK